MPRKPRVTRGSLERRRLEIAKQLHHLAHVAGGPNATFEHQQDTAAAIAAEVLAISLCEQAAEKVIRAVVTSEGQHAGIKHVLAEMVDSIPDENPLKPHLRKIEHLSQYATAYR